MVYGDLSFQRCRRNFNGSPAICDPVAGLLFTEHIGLRVRVRAYPVGRDNHRKARLRGPRTSGYIPAACHLPNHQRHLPFSFFNHLS